MMYPIFQLAAPYLFTAPNVLSNATAVKMFIVGIWIGFFLIAGFTVFKRILSLVFWCCAPAQSGSKNRCSIRPRALLRRLCHDILFSLLSFLMVFGAVITFAGTQLTFDSRTSLTV